jgi:hypothetical protein
MKSRLKLVKPDVGNRAVAPTRLANSEYRSREHLTPSEVEKLIEAAKTNRYGHRDATMLLVAYRHGLRASELCELEWSQVDFNSATLHVRRAKNGRSRFTRTCCDIVQATNSLAMATTHEPFKTTLGIGVSATLSDIRNYRRHASRSFGGIRCRRERCKRSRQNAPRASVNDLSQDALRDHTPVWTGPTPRACADVAEKYQGCFWSIKILVRFDGRARALWWPTLTQNLLSGPHVHFRISAR